MNDEQNQLRRRAKRRLLGAVILVTALVVFLPMVLDDEPKPVSDDIAINIPSQDGKGPTSLSPKIVPALPAKPEPTPTPAAEAKMAEPPQPEAAPPVQALTVLPGGQPPKLAAAEPPRKEIVKAETAKPEVPAEQPKAPAKPVESAAKLVAAKPAPSSETKPVEPPKPTAKPVEAAKPAAKPEPAKEAKPAAQGGFVVRLGAFAKPENAKQLKAKLSSMGIRNYSDLVKTPSGDKHRVRAGPFATHKEADTARERLKAVNVVGDVVQKP